MREVEIVRQVSPTLPCHADGDLSDHDLLSFALTFARARQVCMQVDHLLAEFGDIEIILASSPAELRTRGRLCHRAVGVLKLLHAFRADNRRGRLLN